MDSILFIFLRYTAGSIVPAASYASGNTNAHRTTSAAAAPAAISQPRQTQTKTFSKEHESKELIVYLIAKHSLFTYCICTKVEYWMMIVYDC